MMDVPSILSAVTTDGEIFLDNLNDDEFQRVVSADVKRTLDPVYRDALTQPELNGRVIDALDGLLGELESKIAQREADLLDGEMEEADFQRWLAKTLYFKTSVEKRLAAAKRAKSRVKVKTPCDAELILKKIMDNWYDDEDPECVVISFSLIEEIEVYFGAKPRPGTFAGSSGEVV